MYVKNANIKNVLRWVCVGLITLVHLQTWAQNYPTKPIKFIVAFTAGSGTDVIARSVGDVMSASLGQQVVIENKPGAGGTIAASQVAKSEPDGYNFLVQASGHALNPFIYTNLSYDTLKDLTGVTPLAALPNVLVVSPSKSWKTVTDLVNATKEKPGELNFASAGIGSATHMNAEKFNLAASVKATHVPYKGTPEAISDVIGGRADWYFAPLSTALPLIQGGKLKALAVSTAKRSSALPNIPTTVESGVANSDFVFWVGLIAPAGTPPAIVKRINDEVIKALNNNEVKERFVKLGAEAMPMSPEGFNQFIKSEMDVASRISKAANLKAN